MEIAQLRFDYHVLKSFKTSSKQGVKIMLIIDYASRGWVYITHNRLQSD